MPPTGHCLARKGFIVLEFLESVLTKIDDKCFGVLNKTYLFYEDKVDISHYIHYITHCNIYLNLYKDVFSLSCFRAKIRVLACIIWNGVLSKGKKNTIWMNFYLPQLVRRFWGVNLNWESDITFITKRSLNRYLMT